MVKGARMKKLLFYLISFFILSGGASITFAEVYIENFEDAKLDEPWFSSGTYEIENETLNMIGGFVLPNGVISSELGLYFNNNNELIYHFEGDIYIPEGYSLILGIGIQWSQTVNDSWERYQVFLKFMNNNIHAILGREYPSGGDLIAQEMLAPANFNDWYHLSITLNDGFITYGINGNETNLFHGLFSYKPTLIIGNAGYVHGHDPLTEIRYYTDNIKAFTSTGTSTNDIMRSLYNSFSEWRAGGEIIGVGGGGLADVRLNTFRVILGIAGLRYQFGNFNGACNLLNNAYNRSDGLPRPPDLVEGDAVQDLNQMINILRTNMGCE
jgi:hypothetical protein